MLAGKKSSIFLKMICTIARSVEHNYVVVYITMSVDLHNYGTLFTYTLARVVRIVTTMHGEHTNLCMVNTLTCAW